MRGQAGFFEVDDRLKELSAKDDALERLNAVVDFELFRADLERAVPRSDRSKGGRPPFDHVLMFKALVLQASHNLSDERTEYLIRDRLSFMRFLDLGLADTVPDANTIWTYREALTRARIAGKPAIEVVFERFDAALAAAGFLAMSGQIIDASIVAAPKQRNTDGEKRDIKEGRIPPEWAKSRAGHAIRDVGHIDVVVERGCLPGTTGRQHRSPITLASAVNRGRLRKLSFFVAVPHVLVNNQGRRSIMLQRCKALLQHASSILSDRFLQFLLLGVIGAAFVFALGFGASAPVVIGVLVVGFVTALFEAAHHRDKK
jgi:Transposase domain (DUF772)